MVARAVALYTKNKKVSREIGESALKEKEISPEKFAEMFPFMEQLVAQVLVVGHEKTHERERIILEHIEKARIEKGNFGWIKLLPFHFLDEKEDEKTSQDLDFREGIKRQRDETFDKVFLCFLAALYFTYTVIGVKQYCRQNSQSNLW